MKRGRTAAFLIIVSVVLKPINLLKEIVIAAIFGAGALRDAFVVAWQIPNLVGSMVSEGLPQVFVPWLTQLRERNREEYTQALSTVSNLLIAALFVLSALIVVSAPLCVSLTAPFLSPVVKVLSINLLRVMAFSILFLGLSSLLTGLLYSHQSFVVPALTIPLMSLIVIFFIWFGSSRIGIYSLALGTLVGSLGMVLIQFVFLPGKKEFAHRIRIRYNKEIKEFLFLGGFFLLGTLIFNLNAIVEKVFASTLPAGNISYLDYAFRIVQLVFTIFTPVTVVIFPKLCVWATNLQTKEEFANLISKGIKTIMFLALPASAILFALRLPVVEIVYRRGAFTQEAANFTSNLVGIYGLGLVPHSVNFLLIHTFYTRKEMSVRIKYGLIFLVSSIVLNFILIGRFKVYGIALANSLSAFVSTLFLTAVLLARVRLPGKELLNSLVKLGFLSLVTGILTSKIWNLLSVRLELFLAFATSLVGAVFILLLGVHILRIREIKYAYELVPELWKKWKR